MTGNPDLEKNWKEELVVVDGQWYSDDTLPEEIPSTTFGIAKQWKKPTSDKYDKVLIQELGFLTQLPVSSKTLEGSLKTLEGSSFLESSY